MKKIASIVAVAVVVLLAACGGVDEKLVADITKFEGDWSALSTKAGEWGTTWTTETGTISNDLKMWSENLPKNLKGDAQKKADTLNMKSADVSKEIETVTADFGSFKGSIDEATTAFGEWKGKVLKGEVKGEDAKKELENYMTSLSGNTTKLDEFGAKLEAIKAKVAELKSGYESLAPNK